MLARARRRYSAAVSAGRLVLHAGSLRQLPLPDASVDGLVTTNTVCFVDDLREVFAELARVLAPSGRAVIGVGDPEAMAQMPFTPYGFCLRDVSDLVPSARTEGLELRSHEHSGDGPRPFHILALGLIDPTSSWDSSSRPGRAARRPYVSRPARAAPGRAAGRPGARGHADRQHPPLRRRAGHLGDASQPLTSSTR